MTTVTRAVGRPDQAQWRQLVLFPELLGVSSVPLQQCQQIQPAQEEERKERRLSLKEALAAGQMLLW